MKRFKKWKEEKYNKAAASVSASLDWFEKDIISYYAAMKRADDEIQDYTQKELSYIQELTTKVIFGETTVNSLTLRKRQKKFSRDIFWMKFYKRFVIFLISAAYSSKLIWIALIFVILFLSYIAISVCFFNDHFTFDISVIIVSLRNNIIRHGLLYRNLSSCKILLNKPSWSIFCHVICNQQKNSKSCSQNICTFLIEIIFLRKNLCQDTIYTNN